MSRYVLGPQVLGPVSGLFSYPVSDPGPPPPKADVTVQIAGVSEDGLAIHVAVPPYDAATHNVLSHVHVVYAPAPIPDGADEDVDWFLAGDFPSSTGTAPAPETGGTVELYYRGPHFEGFRYVQTILEFAE